MESTADPDYNEDSPRACRWIATKKTVKSIRTPTYRERLDRLQIPDVCWIPYGEHRSVRDFHMISCYSGLLPWGPVVVYYRPERVMWQFRYTQTIPVPPVDSWVSFDDIYDRWMHYSDHMAANMLGLDTGGAQISCSLFTHFILKFDVYTFIVLEPISLIMLVLFISFFVVQRPCSIFTKFNEQK